ncbi:MAG: rhomboid family intramembrane serine protease [Verrucomicrobiales bacterium]|jgi:membrane associated rhomboid family serine protease|tara:strand:+ start:9111 stop:9740 length:630 start_codon:yes stop_codon:yes gene_type:complete
MQAELKKRLPVVLLMVVVIIATFYDWIVGLDGWMAVPLEITQAWKQALEGNFSSEVVAELASVMGANFLHAGGNHLMGNMLMFWIFGAVVLEIVGWRWLFAIFVLTGIGAVVGHTLLDPYSPIPMLGASGIVMGFQGAYLGLSVQRPRGETQVWPIAHPVSPSQLAGLAIFGVMLDFMGVTGLGGSNTAYGAHIGGFVTGMVVSYLRRG